MIGAVRALDQLAVGADFQIVDVRRRNIGAAEKGAVECGRHREAGTGIPVTDSRKQPARALVHRGEVTAARAEDQHIIEREQTRHRGLRVAHGRSGTAIQREADHGPVFRHEDPGVIRPQRGGRGLQGN